MSEDTIAPAPSGWSPHRRTAVLAGTFVAIAAVAVISVTVLHAVGWSGTVGAIGYRPSSQVAVGCTGARVTVPQDWQARKSLSVPAWMGFSPSLDSQNSVLLSPVQNDGRELSVSWGSPSSNWSDIEPSSQLNRLDPGPELKAAGVRTVAVRSLSGSDGTEPDMAEVYLFVDNAAGRYLLSLTVDAPPEQVTAELALTALRQAGFSFR